MKENVIAKLKGVLIRKISNELQVVYVLTRIGKILELENNKDSYPVLKFYRDWSVHTVLDRKKHQEVIGILKDFIEKKENRQIFSIHTKFCSELNSFLDKNDLPRLNKNRLSNFVFYLGKIISDTPIKLTIDKQQYCISISESVKKDWSGLYAIFPTYYSPEG